MEIGGSMLRIGFWINERGTMISHSTGLTLEQVEELKKLKVGDRLVVWNNTDREKSTSPSHSLKVFIPKEKTDAVREQAA